MKNFSCLFSVLKLSSSLRAQRARQSRFSSKERRDCFALARNDLKLPKRHIFSSILFLFVAIPAFCGSGSDKELFSKLLETGRMADARDLAQRAAPPDERRIWMSSIYFYSGDYNAAKDEIATQESGDTTRLFAYYARLAEIAESFTEFQSEHFIFRAGGADVILKDLALDALEKAYRRIGANLSHFPAEKIIVEVYRTKEDFSLASTLPEDVLEKSGTVGICKFNRLMILTPQALPLGYNWLDTLAHEYTHLLVNRLSRAGCPLWLHEGIARYHDTLWRLDTPQYLSAEGENRLKDAVTGGKLIPFKRMSPSLVYLDSQDDISLGFAEVATATAYILERFGDRGLSALLEQLSSGAEAAAFKKALGVSPEKFEKQFHAYLAALPLQSSPGAASSQPQFTAKADEEFIGADIRGLTRLGDNMRRIGRPDAAALQYEKALAQEPANPVLLLKTARALLESGNTEKAEEKLLLAIEKNPNYVTPYQVLAELYFARRQFNKAQKQHTAALSINPFLPPLGDAPN